MRSQSVSVKLTRNHSAKTFDRLKLTLLKLAPKSASKKFPFLFAAVPGCNLHQKMEHIKTHRYHPVSRQLRGVRRDTMSSAMQHVKPNEFRARLAATAEKISNIPTLPVLQKAASEHRSKPRVCNNDLDDLITRCSRFQSHFVRAVVVEDVQPTMILCWLSSATDILKRLHNSRISIKLGIDSTGAPVFSWPGGKGAYYYYGIVLLTSSNNQLPMTSVCDIFSSTQTTSQLYTAIFKWCWEVP